MTTESKAELIAAQNDEFRSYTGLPVFGPKLRGHFAYTVGISALPPEVQIGIWARVRDFTDFTPGNDPHGEHDFGSFSMEGAGTIFWKIDYYAPDLTYGSEDPSDPEQTFRVLTIMLASEY